MLFRSSARRIEQPVLTDDDMGNLFDAITYEKGQTVLAMFEAWTGPAAFQAGVRRHLGPGHQRLRVGALAAGQRAVGDIVLHAARLSLHTAFCLSHAPAPAAATSYS